MSDTRYMKKNDRWPPLSVKIAYSDPTLDITQSVGVSTSVTFKITNSKTTDVIVNGAGTVTVGNKHVIASYQWLAGETSVPGEYDVDVIFSVGGLPGTAPSHAHLKLVIE